MNPAKQQLSTKNIGDILATRPPLPNLVCVDAQTHLSKAFELLSKYHILSLPVYDSTERCVGFVDNLHVMSYICSHLEAGQCPETIDLEVPVKKIINNAKWDPLLTATTETPVVDLLKWFASGLSHRAVVQQIGINGSVSPTICSQTDIVRFLALAMTPSSPDHSGTTDEKLMELGRLKAINILKNETQHLRGSEHPREYAGTTRVVEVHPNQTVSEAILAMNKAMVSAVALVNGEGEVVGNFSSSDLRGLRADDLHLLKEPVKEFLAKKSPKSTTPIVVDEEATFLDMIKLMVSHRVHRVWLVNSKKRNLVDVITMSDIMKFICYH